MTLSRRAWRDVLLSGLVLQSAVGTLATQRNASSVSGVVTAVGGVSAAARQLMEQFRDMKIIPTTELIAPRLAEFATACGETLAKAHARTGDPVAIEGYIGKGPSFTAAMIRLARSYADQNERDHAQLLRAIADGTVESTGEGFS